jgi:hypothetical protein
MGDEGARTFPVVCGFEGGPSPDGSSLLVEATGFDGSVTRFAIPVENVKHVVAFLLAWAGTIGDNQPYGDESDRVGAGILPIPATSIAIGEPSGGEGYIGISVGCAELVFSLPLSAFGPLGQTLLMAAEPPSMLRS